MLTVRRGTRLGWLLKRLTYIPPLQAVVRGLGVREPLRKLYFRFALPSDGIVEINLWGIPAKFRAQSPVELRIIESGGGELPLLKRLMDFLSEGDVFMDVGANIGIYTVALAKKVGPSGCVLAFEPESENFRKLRENVGLNGLGNVQVFRKALGRRPARERLYFGADLTDARLNEPPADQDLGSEEVDIVDGDGFRKSECFAVPRVVKIDVEGYEYNVLEGLRETLRNPECQAVCCEVHSTLLPAGINTASICELLRSLGFDRFEWDVPPGAPLAHVMAFKSAAVEALPVGYAT